MDEENMNKGCLPFSTKTSFISLVCPCYMNCPVIGRKRVARLMRRCQLVETFEFGTG